MFIWAKRTDNSGMPNSLQINSDYKRTLLEGLELFRDVDADDVQMLLQACDRRDIETGEQLLAPGDKNEHVYIVLSGSLSVHVGASDAPILATINPGECVGEMSIIEDRDPSAFVLAAEATHLLEIHRRILWQMVNASHEFSKNLLVILSERVRSHNQVIAESVGELRKIERHANTDALTGLSNRHTMNEKFGREINRCIKNNSPIALIMIDVDNFKCFNDRFGHVAGDRALSAVASILKRQFRPRDLLVRYGGDEFAVLLPDVDLELATTIANRVRSSVSGDTGESDDSLIQIPIRISMGVAILKKGQSLSDLIKDADAALYRAKKTGRNAVCN